MAKQERCVWVVGHKNPDTDSICAAISYAYLKNQTETVILSQRERGASTMRRVMCWSVLGQRTGADHGCRCPDQGY